MSEVWSKWQGQVIDGTFPLHRYLGGTDHSGVFLVELAGREPPEVAIKLVPVTTALGEAYLEHWDTAAGLDHPHLIRILQTGRWELDGLPFVYCVMEYSDQNLAQLLEHRAMTEDEAREMLPPVLSALSFLHNKNLVQGQLKPSNILVVGDQVKLASDTICRVSEVPGGVNTVSIYDPPEAGDGRSAAGDIWALGVTLFEALTRSPSLALDVRRGGVVLPADFSPPFREVVSSCLSRRPFDRPKLGEIEARIRGQGEGTSVLAEPVPAAVGLNGGQVASVGEVHESPALDGEEAPSGTGARDEVLGGDLGFATEDAEGGATGTPEVGVRTDDESDARDLEWVRGDAAGGAVGTLEGGLQTREESIADDLEETGEAVVGDAAGISALGSLIRGESDAEDLEETSENIAGSAAMVSAPRMPPRDRPAALDAESVRQAVSVLAAEATAALERAAAAHAVLVRGHKMNARVGPAPEGNAPAGAPTQSPADSLPLDGTASIPALATLEDIATASGRAGSSTSPSMQTAEIEEFFAPLDESDEATGFMKPAVATPPSPAGAPVARSAPPGPAVGSGSVRAPVSPSTSASGSYRAPTGVSPSASGTYRAPVVPSTAASGTYRAPGVGASSESGTYRAPVAPSTAASGNHRAPGVASSSESGTYRAPTAASTAASGAYRAPGAPSSSESGTYRAPTAASTSASGTHRAAGAPSSSESGTYRAPTATSTAASGTYRAPTAASTAASGTHRAVGAPSASESGTYRAPTAAPTSASGTHRAAGAPSSSESGTYRAPTAASTSASGTHRAVGAPSTSESGTYRAPGAPSTSASGTYRAPVAPLASAGGAERATGAPSTSNSGIYRAPANAATSASGTYRSPVGLTPVGRVPGPAGQPTSTPASGGAPAAAAHSVAALGATRPASISSSETHRSPVAPVSPGTEGHPAPAGLSAAATDTHRAPASASTAASGTHRSPGAPSSSESGTYRAPAPPSTAATGSHRAVGAPSTSESGTYRTPTPPSTSPSGIFRAPAGSAAGISGIYRSPVGSAPAARVPGPAGQVQPMRPAASAVPLPTRPVSTSTSGIYKSPVAPGAPAQAARAAAPRSAPISQRQWSNSEEIMVRLPTSEPAVLQRIIGQPVTVLPAALTRLQAQELLADGAPADEPHLDETELLPNAGRASTSQRYLILLCLVVAVIFPLCWAGLGAIRPDQDKTRATQAPQAAPQHSAITTPVAPSSPEATADVESPPGTMQPGDAAMPAGGAGSVSQPGSQAGMPGSAVGTEESGSSGPIGINLRIPGHVSAARGARVSGGAGSGGAHAPGGTGAVAATGTSASAARPAGATRNAALSDMTNRSADSGGAVGVPGEHEEVPDVPAQIRKTIRGHVKVSVRVIIDQGGSVFAALVDNPGPSHYFDKVSIEAAKKWTFPPAESGSRLKLVRFDFTRDGTTGEAVEVSR